jgi:HEAT repeat protein
MFTWLKVWRPSRRLFSNDRSVRQDAAEAIGKLGDRRAVEPLIEALGDWRKDVDEYAAKMLHLTMADLTQTEVHVGMAAAEALGKLGDRRAVAPLIKALTHRFEDVGKTAAEALTKLGDPRSV